ncbi:unnamed protein product [Soboliphyme baturini]|uniref:Ion_trans domain-containing protein n=1 Tax=Soboliphyme baturini TaxID=241478 RepID=A0A183IX24_9BILA|nr:unnamed protein product [Soboliphyme baturini]
MVIDILKFFFVYSLVLFAFACGLNQLFWYYATMRQNECGKSNNKYLPEDVQKEMAASCDPEYSAFANLYNTIETLFWSILGVFDLDHLRLKENHVITEWAGKTMLGTYGIISVVVLLNMLIAMMSNSYQYISDQSDVEWKFARSKLWIEYFDESGTLPPPFNIVPSPKSFWNAFIWLIDRCCHVSLKKLLRARRTVRLEKILKRVSDMENNYQFVIRNLVKRYIANIQHKKQNMEGVTEDDIAELKQDISAFRYELLAVLRRAGFETNGAESNSKNSKTMLNHFLT